nr:DUF6499 domain-containing protein [Bradyrhizobium sp.]
MTASDLAWEWLRRNESYDKDFQALNDSKIDPHPLTDKIRQRWGLRFRGGPVAVPARSAGVLAPPRGHKRHRSGRAARCHFRKH